MSELQLTPYQQDCLGQLSTAAFRIASALERMVEIAEVAASGWLNACPPRGEYSPDMNANRRGPTDPIPGPIPETAADPKEGSETPPVSVGRCVVEAGAGATAGEAKPTEKPRFSCGHGRNSVEDFDHE